MGIAMEDSVESAQDTANENCKTMKTVDDCTGWERYGDESMFYVK